jgi:hypothetical protein
MIEKQLLPPDRMVAAVASFSLYMEQGKYDSAECAALAALALGR